MARLRTQRALGLPGTFHRPVSAAGRADAYTALDAAVAAAYGWPADISDEEALRELLELNLTRGG